MTRREILKKEAKSLLVFCTAYAVGAVIYLQFATTKRELSSWLFFGAGVVTIAYLVPALLRLRATPTRMTSSSANCEGPHAGASGPGLR